MWRVMSAKSRSESVVAERRRRAGRRARPRRGPGRRRSRCGRRCGRRGRTGGCSPASARRRSRSGRARRRSSSTPRAPRGRTPRPRGRPAAPCRPPGLPSGSNVPRPKPSGLRWLCASSELGRLEEPEGGADRLAAGVESEESAHGRADTVFRRRAASRAESHSQWPPGRPLPASAGTVSVAWRSCSSSSASLALYVNPALSWFSTLKESKQRDAEVRAARAREQRLHKRRAELRDPKALEREARRLGMVRPGERAYVVEGLAGRGLARPRYRGAA